MAVTVRPVARRVVAVASRAVDELGILGSERFSGLFSVVY
jgi:hypothetical protein